MDFLVLDREFDYLWLFAIVKKSQRQLLEIDHWRTEQKASTSNMSQFILFSQPENKSHQSYIYFISLMQLFMGWIETMYLTCILFQVCFFFEIKNVKQIAKKESVERNCFDGVNWVKFLLH